MAEMTNREYAILWLEGIAEMAERLTTGNVSHLGATIKCKAQDSVQYLEKWGDSNDEVLHKAIKRLKWVVKDCSGLCTGNVAHRRPGLVGFSRRMAEYVRRHIND
jgi:hypothetical protein